MIYPLFSYDDGTEITASKPDESGIISLYIERFDESCDCFINATLSVPNLSIKSSNGFPPAELASHMSLLKNVENDIVDYVMEKVKRSA